MTYNLFGGMLNLNQSIMLFAKDFCGFQLCYNIQLLKFTTIDLSRSGTKTFILFLYANQK